MKRILSFAVLSFLSFAFAWLLPGEFQGRDWSYFNSLSQVVRSSVLSYGSFPFHDPWVLGGMDLLSNPQTRIFSPSLLFDLLFPPMIAHLAVLTLQCFLGMIGMFRFLRKMELGEKASFLGAVLFCNGTWFGLHFAEGHIPFGVFQLRTSSNRPVLSERTFLS
jgi:hypothetical protein